MFSIQLSCTFPWMMSYSCNAFRILSNMHAPCIVELEKSFSLVIFIESKCAYECNIPSQLITSTRKYYSSEYVLYSLIVLYVLQWCSLWSLIYIANAYRTLSEIEFRQNWFESFSDIKGICV